MFTTTERTALALADLRYALGTDLYDDWWIAQSIYVAKRPFQWALGFARGISLGVPVPITAIPPKAQSA